MIRMRGAERGEFLGGFILLVFRAQAADQGDPVGDRQRFPILGARFRHSAVGRWSCRHFRERRCGSRCCCRRRSSGPARGRIAFARHICGALRSRGGGRRWGRRCELPTDSRRIPSGFLRRREGIGRRRERGRRLLPWVSGYRRCCRRWSGGHCGRRSGARLCLGPPSLTPPACIIASYDQLFFRLRCRGALRRRRGRARIRFRSSRRRVGNRRRLGCRAHELVRRRDLEHADGDGSNRRGRGEWPPAPSRGARFARLPSDQRFRSRTHFAARGCEDCGIDRRGRFFRRRFAPCARDARIDGRRAVVRLRGNHCKSPSSSRSFATA